MKARYNLTREKFIALRNLALQLIVNGAYAPQEYGSCVCGNGISIPYIPKGCRKVRWLRVVTNGDFGCQSEQRKVLLELMVNLKAVRPDIEFRYEEGNMD